MPHFAAPALDLLDASADDVLALVCYHYAKFFRARLQNIILRPRRNFNGANMLVLLQRGSEHVFLLVCGPAGYAPRGVFYGPTAFQEVGDCKTAVGGVEAANFSLRGKVLAIGGDITAYEQGCAYDVSVAE